MEDLDADKRAPNAVAAAFTAMLPSHAVGLILTHNYHKSCYETVERYTLFYQFRDDEWVSPEQRDMAIRTGEIWECQWYPNTPVVFRRLAACELGALLAALADIDRRDG